MGVARAEGVGVGGAMPMAGLPDSSMRRARTAAMSGCADTRTATDSCPPVMKSRAADVRVTTRVSGPGHVTSASVRA